jgi:hypothetical protein
MVRETGQILVDYISLTRQIAMVEPADAMEKSRGDATVARTAVQ